jgi:hypothetical protein
LNPSAPPPAPVMCGGKTCSAPMSMIPGFMLTACCQSDNECGASFPAMGGGGGGGCLSTAAGTPDTACPSVRMMGFPIPGCCTTMGLCGLDLTMAGLGCNPASALAGLGPPGAMAMSDAGPPETCAAAAAAADAGGGSDAGAE